ncbi:MAG: type II toxin-antitoxin system RelE/ParE family toxin [Mucilaginibacter sp.]
MTYTFFVLSKAQQEILSAWEWYEDKQPELGDRFKRELAKKIKSILDNPLQYPLKGRFHEVKTDDFPYLIVFKIDEKRNQILIVSVFHTSRNPAKKHK